MEKVPYWELLTSKMIQVVSLTRDEQTMCRNQLDENHAVRYHALTTRRSSTDRCWSEVNLSRIDCTFLDFADCDLTLLVFDLLREDCRPLLISYRHHRAVSNTGGPICCIRNRHFGFYHGGHWCAVCKDASATATRGQKTGLSQRPSRF